jgi:hypothetical protein
MKADIEKTLSHLSLTAKKNLGRVVIEGVPSGGDTIKLEVSVHVYKEDGSEIEYTPFTVDIGVPGE